MVAIARATTWASLQVLTASALNGEFNVVFNAWNNADAGTGLWNNVKISSTSSNPMEVKSSAAACEMDIDCTGTNGTPIFTWRRSGATYFTAGVDGAASNLFKFATTGLTANVAWQVPTAGLQVQFASGTVSAPALAFISEANTGWFRGGGSRMDLAIGGVNTVTFNASAINTASQYQAPDGSNGSPSISFSNATTSGAYKSGTNGFSLATNGVERLRFDANGNIANVAGALATTATNGFIYVETCAGTPTGVPTSITGSAPIIFDTSANKIWVYNSSWKGVAVS